VRRMRKVGPEAAGLWVGTWRIYTRERGHYSDNEPLLQYVRLPELAPRDDLPGARRLRRGPDGALKVNTKEDMAENSRMIVLWGSNIASQPNTARHIISAQRRGAKVITIDVHRTEAAAQSDEMLLIRPGVDAALTFAVMHVIVTENLCDAAFVGSHTTGFEELSKRVLPFTPRWRSEKTGIEANRIISFARAYASTRPA
jgi:predicted molibdopterin-dependent oxidoreductase YjgC